MADFAHGFYSEAQDTIHGHWVYTTPAGNQVKVTFTDDVELIERPKTLWPDIRYIGPVVSCLRSERKYPPQRSITICLPQAGGGA